MDSNIGENWEVETCSSPNLARKETPYRKALLRKLQLHIQIYWYIKIVRRVSQSGKNICDSCREKYFQHGEAFALRNARPLRMMKFSKQCALVHVIMSGYIASLQSCDTRRHMILIICVSFPKFYVLTKIPSPHKKYRLISWISRNSFVITFERMYYCIIVRE